MKNTGIQWCDDTANPTSGCDGCELWIPGVGGPCYAGNLHETRLSKSLPNLYDPLFTNVRLIPGRMAKIARCMDLKGRARSDKPWLDGYRRKIFVGDLGDIFSAAVPFEYLKSEIMDVATGKDGTRHDFLLLTKQPNRAAAFAAWLGYWPENVWIGTSITSKTKLSRLQHLVKVPARHRFVSLEPLVGDPGLTVENIIGVDWLIIGGESDQGEMTARPFYLNWARDVIALGAKTNTAVFNKQLGSLPMENSVRVKLEDHHGGDWLEWAADLRVRQMPFTSN